MVPHRGVGSLWGDKALEGQVIVCEQWFAPPMLCLLRTFQRLWFHILYFNNWCCLQVEHGKDNPDLQNFGWFIHIQHSVCHFHIENPVKWHAGCMLAW